MTVTFCHNYLDAAREPEHLVCGCTRSKRGEVIVTVVLAGAGICEK